MREGEQETWTQSGKWVILDAYSYVQGIIYTMGHKATILHQVQRSVWACLNVYDHPPGLSLGSEYFGELQSSSDAVLDANSNVARISTLQHIYTM